MELIGLIFNNIFFGPLVNLMVLIFKLLELAHIPGALGFSLIILTVLIRAIIWPFTGAQVKSAQKMASLKPHLDELKERHKGDKVALQQAQMALYKEHGVNPAAGCLPTLIQFPVIIALYQVITTLFINSGNHGLDRMNALLYHPWLHLQNLPDTHFFGVNLASKPSEFASVGVFVLLIPFITAALTFVQSKMMAPIKPLKIRKDDTPTEVKEKEGMEDAMASMQSQMSYFMPLMIGYFAFTFPIGLAIYWNTFTIMGIIQQHRISGWGGMTDLIGKIWKTN